MSFDTRGLFLKYNLKKYKLFVDSKGETIAKECSKCSIIKHVNEFGRDSRKTGRYRGACRECENKSARKRYKENPNSKKKYYEINKPRIRARKIKHYQKFKEKYLKWNREWREKNKEAYYEYHKKYREENREKRIQYYEENKEWIQEKRRRWGIENKELVRLAAQRRRARKRKLPDTLTRKQQEEIIANFKGACALSEYNNFDEIHLDHVIPLNTGRGGTIYENIIPLRSNLNESKGDKNIFDWFADNRDRFGLEQRKFDELVEYLADINDMSTKEYEEYVRWCHDNPRTIDEINAEEINNDDAS